MPGRIASASGRTPISAKLVANLITQAGGYRVLTLDLHAGQIQGFFDIPTDNLYAVPVMARDIKAKYNQLANVMVVSPDVGGVVRARALAKRLDGQLAIVDKRRDRPGKSEVMNIIGDVSGKDCLLIDDIVNSGGTLCNAAEALLENGATSVTAYITHGVLSGGAVARIAASKLKELVITNSIQPTTAVNAAHNIRVITIAELIGEAISRTATRKASRACSIELAAFGALRALLKYSLGAAPSILLKHRRERRHAVIAQIQCNPCHRLAVRQSRQRREKQRLLPPRRK